MQPSQNGLELLGLSGGDRICKDRSFTVLRHPGNALRREVGVQHHHLAAVQQLAAAGQHPGGEILVNVHVRHGQLHISGLIVDEQVGGGVATGDHRRLGDVDAQLAAYCRQLLGVHVVAEGRDQPHIQAHEAHVVGDVPAHAAGAHAHGTGIGVLTHQGLIGPAADVHIHAAHYGDIGAACHNIPLAGDAALFHQIGDVYRHAGAGDACPVRQLLLGDHRIRLDPVEDLSLTLCHGSLLS